MITRSKIIEEAQYLISNHATIRKTAQKFNRSKTTIHKDLTKTLKTINLELYQQVKKVLNKNFETKHLNGGQATKLKYRN